MKSGIELITAEDMIKRLGLEKKPKLTLYDAMQSKNYYKIKYGFIGFCIGCILSILAIIIGFYCA